jgi:protein-disulfide isomerase
MLKDSQYSTARQAFVDKLRGGAEVKIVLDAPRLSVDLSGAPMRGPDDAPVTIVEYSDFQCPFCRRVQPTLSTLQERYGDKIRWSFKDLPLVSIHPAAQKAAQAARCAGEQGKFWQYREELFQNTKISDDLHDEISSKLELDKPPFQSCLDSEKFKAAVEADSAEAQSFGITGTPAFVINGILLSGAQPLEAFTAVIERELEIAEND